jgi:hypothetical protein
MLLKVGVDTLSSIKYFILNALYIVCNEKGTPESGQRKDTHKHNNYPCSDIELLFKVLYRKLK